MKLIAFLFLLNIAIVLSISLHSGHRSRHRSHSKSKFRHKNRVMYRARGGDEETANENESAPAEPAPPRVNGNFFDTGSYSTVNWLSQKGIPDESALIFVSTVYWTESYIYFRKTRTLNEKSDSGAVLEEKVFLFSPDSHDAYLPYYFFVDGIVEIDDLYSAWMVKTVDKKLHPLFDFTRGADSILHLSPISTDVSDNMQYILDGMKEKVKNAYILYNQRVMLIRDSINEITAIKEEIIKTKQELDKKMKDDMFEYYLAKAEIVKSTLNSNFAAVLDEIETQENTKEVAARKFCDNIYLNGDFNFFRDLMGDEWNKVSHGYDYTLDKGEGHFSDNKTPDDTNGQQTGEGNTEEKTGGKAENENDE